MSKPNDSLVASRLAADVRSAESAGERKTWRKMTALVDLFGVYRLSPAVRERLVKAVWDAGLETEPHLSIVRRSDMVMLQRRQPVHVDNSPVPSPAPAPAEPVLSASLWTPGQSPVAFDVGATRARPVGSVLWVEVNVQADAREVLAAISPLFKEHIPLEAVVDLLTADQRPKIAQYDEVRSVSILGVSCSEALTGGDDADESKAGSLTFQLVEFLTGAGWLISCWHRSRCRTGSNHEREGDPVGRQQAMAAVATQWARMSKGTSGDLGLLLAGTMALGFAKAHRDLSAWLESWEMDFHRRKFDTEVKTVNDVRMLTSELHHQLSAFNQSRNDGEDRTWFPFPSHPSLVAQLNEQIDRALRNLRWVSEGLHSAMQLVSMSNLTRQMEMSAQQQEQSKRTGHQVERAAALLLVPTLIAGIFGANTALPGQGHWSGFVFMLLLIVASAGLVYYFLRRSSRAPD